MARKNAVVSVAATADAISFNVEGFAPINLTLANLSDDVRNRAMVHGLVQKISDAAAIKFENNETDEQKAEAKHAAMQSVVDRLNSGEWNKRGDGDASSAPSGLIRRAAYEWLKTQRPDLTDEKFEAWYSAKDRSAVLALRKVPEIADIIERMKSERGTINPVDASGLLSELDGL